LLGIRSAADERSSLASQGLPVETRRILALLLACIILAFAVYEGGRAIWYIGARPDWGAPFEYCVDISGVHELNTPEYKSCAKDQAEQFIKVRYPDFKDTIKSFITIIVGTFVASITFSEKIVNFSATSVHARTLLVACWLSLLSSIVCNGVSLLHMNYAFAQAIVRPEYLDLKIVFSGIRFLVASFILFCSGLALMFAAAILAMTFRAK